MPISGYKDGVEEVYEQVEEVMDTVKKNDNLIILGDWNAVVCEGQEMHAVGKYELGVRSNQMQQYADIYLLQSYSTCSGCHSTHHQEY